MKIWCIPCDNKKNNYLHMKLIKYIFLFFTGFLGMESLEAQTSLVHIYDLAPDSYIDTLAGHPEIVELNVSFKIENTNQADSVFFMLGTNPNTADIANATGKFRLINGSYFVEISTNQYPVLNDETSCQLILSESQLDLSNYLSMFVKDLQGNISNSLNIRIN